MKYTTGLDTYLRQMELVTTQAYTKPNRTDSNIIVIHGMIGTGKSTLAHAFLNEKSTKARFHNRIHIDASSMTTIKTEFLNLMKIERLERTVTADDETLVAVQTAYRQLAEHSTLVVFDNATKFQLDPDKGVYDISTLLDYRFEAPKIVAPTIVVTTRVAATNLNSDDRLTMIEMKPLDDDNAIAYLKELDVDQLIITSETKRNLTKACDNNPLAIKAYVNNIKRAGKKLYVLPSQYETARIVKLDEFKSISEEFEKILKLPNGQLLASIAMVRAALDCDTVDVNHVKCMFVPSDVRENEFIAAISTLKEHSFLATTSINMNLLMRVACIELLFPKLDKPEQLLKKVINHLKQVFIDQMTCAESLQDIASFVNFAVLLITSSLFGNLPNDLSSMKQELICEVLPMLGSFDAACCWRLFEEQGGTEWSDMLKPEASKLLLNSVLTISGWTSSSKKVAKELVSSVFQEQSWYKLWQMDYWLTGNSQQVLSMNPKSSSELPHCLETLVYAGHLQRFNELINNGGSSRLEDVQREVWIAKAQSTQGKISESLKICSRILSTKLCVQDALEYWEQHAILLSDLGEFSEALHDVNKVCTARRQFEGPTGISYLRAVFLKSKILRNKGDVEEALELLNNTLEELKSMGNILQPDDFDVEAHPFVLHVCQCIGKHYFNLGIHRKALPIFEDVYEKRLKVLGHDSFHTMDSLFYLALVRRDIGIGDIFSSVKTLKQLGKFNELLKETNVHVLRYKIEEANTIMKAGDVPQAREVLLKVINAAQQAELWRHWCDAQVLQARMAGKEDAIRILLDVHEKSDHFMGRYHKNTLKYKFALAQFYWKERNLEECEAEVNAALDHLVRVAGKINVCTLPWLDLKALLLCDLGEVDKAIELQREVVQLAQERVMTDDHPEVFRYLCISYLKRLLEFLGLINFNFDFCS